jgi:hypothetical protein
VLAAIASDIVQTADAVADVLNTNGSVIEPGGHDLLDGMRGGRLAPAGTIWWSIVG